MKAQQTFDRQEALLQAWIDMSLLVRGNRLVSGMSFNEIVICRILHQRQLQGGEPVTATELCTRMQLLKSQINKILTTMEDAGLIERVRSQVDRRRVDIHLLPRAEELYQTAHKGILEIMTYVCSRLGEEQSQMLAGLLQEAVAAVDSIPRNETERNDE